MEAWLAAHALTPVARPVWPTTPAPERPKETTPISQEQLSGRRARNADTLRKQLRELADTLGVRDLEKVCAFAEFVKARRAARSYAHRHEARGEEGEGDGEPEAREDSGVTQSPDDDEESSPSSRARTASSR
jgi:hypothetical protein